MLLPDGNRPVARAQDRVRADRRGLPTVSVPRPRSTRTENAGRDRWSPAKDSRFIQQFGCPAEAVAEPLAKIGERAIGPAGQRTDQSGHGPVDRRLPPRKQVSRMLNHVVILVVEQQAARDLVRPRSLAAGLYGRFDVPQAAVNDEVAIRTAYIRRTRELRAEGDGSAMPCRVAALRTRRSALVSAAGPS